MGKKGQNNDAEEGRNEAKEHTRKGGKEQKHVRSFGEEECKRKRNQNRGIWVKESKARRKGARRKGEKSNGKEGERQTHGGE